MVAYLRLSPLTALETERGDGVQSKLMEDNDIFHLFNHLLDAKHLMCQVSLKSNKAKLSKCTFKKMVFSAVRTRSTLKVNTKILNK